MQSVTKILVKFFGVSLLCGIGSTFMSAMYASEFCYSQDYLLPCIMKIFTVPQRCISYGWPMVWLVHLEGIEQVGCGPVVGEFSTWSFMWLEFLADVLFYASLFMPILFFRYKTVRGSFDKARGSRANTS